MTLTDFHLFDISVYSLNLFSFMLGMTMAFFKQGLFGKKIGYYIIPYFAGLALWYAIQYHHSGNPDLLSSLYSQFQQLMKTPL